jgi:four helix bundle protein
MSNFKNLVVWQKSLQLAETIYTLTGEFPKTQTYSLSSQMQRAAVSVMSNITEGGRRSAKEWRNFMRIAFGSLGELESQLVLAKRLGFGNEDRYPEIFSEIDHISRILNYYIHKPLNTNTKN